MNHGSSIKVASVSASARAALPAPPANIAEIVFNTTTRRLQMRVGTEWFTFEARSESETFAIAGTITGVVVSGVSLTLKQGSTTIATAVSSVSGTYSFGNLLPGLYTIEAALAGYAFAPASATVTIVGASVSGQNFTSSLVTSTLFGLDKTLVPSNGGVSRLLTLSNRTYLGVTLPAGTARTATFAGGRIFMPIPANNSIAVLRQDTGNLVTTITGGSPTISAPIAVLFEGNKLCIVTATRLHWLNYTFSPTYADTFTIGTNVITLPFTAEAVAHGDNRMFVAGSNSIMELAPSTESVVTTRVIGGVATINAMGYGGGKILANNQLIDLQNNWSQVARATTAFGRVAFAQGKFGLATTSATFETVVAATGVTASLTTGFTGQFPTGCITDGAFFYVANQAGNHLRAVSAANTTLDGGLISGVTSPWFYS